MFTVNQENQIINLAQHRHIRVHKVDDSDKYQIVAYIDKTQGPQMNGIDLDVLATFNEEIEARYSLFNLYSAIEADKSTWNFQAISSFSDLWEKAKLVILSDDRVSASKTALDKLDLSISGFRKITITDLSRNLRGGGSIGSSEEKPIIEALNKALEAECPNGSKWTIEFQDAEDQS